MFNLVRDGSGMVEDGQMKSLGGGWVVFPNTDFAPLERRIGFASLRITKIAPPRQRIDVTSRRSFKIASVRSRTSVTAVSKDGVGVRVNGLNLD
jgi:hypothetical protein